MFLRRLLKINSQKFVFCLRCHFIHLKSQSLNDRELHKQKTAKERRCEDESAKLRMRRSNRSITLPHLCALQIRTFATSHSRIFATKAKVQRQKWPDRETIPDQLVMNLYTSSNHVNDLLNCTFIMNIYYVNPTRIEYTG